MNTEFVTNELVNAESLPCALNIFMRHKNISTVNALVEEMKRANPYADQFSNIHPNTAKKWISYDVLSYRFPDTRPQQNILSNLLLAGLENSTKNQILTKWQHWHEHEVKKKEAEIKDVLGYKLRSHFTDINENNRKQLNRDISAYLWDRYNISDTEKFYFHKEPVPAALLWKPDNFSNAIHPDEIINTPDPDRRWDLFDDFDKNASEIQSYFSGARTGVANEVRRYFDGVKHIYEPKSGDEHGRTKAENSTFIMTRLVLGDNETPKMHIPESVFKHAHNIITH